MSNRNEKEASKVSLDETSNFNFANLKLGQFSMREERERKRCGNVVDSLKTGSTQLLRTEGRRLKRGRGEEGWVEKGNFTGERVQKMGRMGDRVTLSRGERRWMRGEGWMDGWMAKRREREKNFCWKEAGVLRESERGEQHFSVSSKTPAGKMLIISRCFLRVKMHAKNGRPLSRSIFIRCSPFDYLTLVRFLLAEMRFDPVSASSIFLSLCFVHFFVFFFSF